MANSISCCERRGCESTDIPSQRTIASTKKRQPIRHGVAHVLSLGGPSLWRSRYWRSTSARRSWVDSPFCRGRDAMGVLGIRLHSVASLACHT